MDNSLQNSQLIGSKIYTIRGMKVLLDRDLAALYQVKTEALNQSIKRNADRFPLDFVFQLSAEEFENWRSQTVISNSDKMGLRRPPYAFTEHGVAMLSSVLRSKIASEINVKIIRVFIELRQTIVAKQEYEVLKEKVKRIESEILVQNKLSDSKVTQLSRKVYEISDLFDQFRASHIVIQRPEDGLHKG